MSTCITTTRAAALVAAAAVMLTGCAGDPDELVDPGTPTAAATSPGGTDGEVPADVLNRVLGMASDEADVPADALEVVRAEAVRWPDGALGCPQPGQAYTQVVVDGYWIVLAADGEELDYRVGADADTVRHCPEGGEPPLPDEDA